MRFTSLLPAALVALTSLGTTVQAQSNRFAPVVTVNNRAITGYELDQRSRFLKILGAPGDVVAQAKEALIEDRLRLDAAEAAGIRLSDQQVAAGMEEFAGRANLTTEQFLQIIAQAGVEPESFHDFVRAGLAWRELARAKFGPKVSLSNADVDRALSIPAGRGAGPRVLISEILIPYSPGSLTEKQMLADDLVARIGSEGAFAAAARAHSAAPSRSQGGQIGWIPVTNLPPQVRQIVGQMHAGQVSPPIQLGNAIAIVRLRGANQGGDIKPGDITVDFAQFLIPGGRSAEALAEAARIRGEVDTCDDLYRVAKGLPEGQLTRETLPQTRLPGDIARELAPMDDNEVSTGLTRGNALVFLMLCKRSATEALDAAKLTAAAKAESAGATVAVAENGATPPAIDPDMTFATGPTPAQVRDELTNQRLGQLAESYMQDLKANAIIRTP